jgi:uncharacterized protein YkwD
MYKSPQSGFFILQQNSAKKHKATKIVVKTKKMNRSSKSQIWLSTNKTAVLICLAITVTFGGLLFFITPATSSPSNILYTDVNSDDLLLLTNEIRNIKSLNRLTQNKQLQLAATNKAKHIIKHNYFSHNSPAGKQFSEWIVESGYKFQIIGENLAIGFDTNKDVMKAWMDSPSHRKNILNEKYSEIAIVVMQGDVDGQIETVVVQIFGTQQILKLSENFSAYTTIDKYISNPSYS